MNIGLTLSGGGFRATLFHLGVIQYLRSANLLSSVRQVTAVSGGSIIAAHLGINWDRYSGTPQQFRDVADELIRLTQLGAREHVVTWLPIVWTIGRWLPLRWRINQTTLLRNLYSRYLFRKATNDALARHPETPAIHLVATNLTRPNNLISISSTGVQIHGEGGGMIATQAVDLSLAVAASSAFPLLFPPIEISPSLLGVGADALTPSRQFLSDGGIFDNYGLRAMRGIVQQGELDVLVVSDAGARAGWQPDASFRHISLLNRASAISGQRVSDLERRAATTEAIAPRTEFVSIHFADGVADDELTGDLKRQLGAVRTDLDHFSPLLVHCLCRHGYEVARRALAGIDRNVTSRAPGSWNAIAPTVPLSADNAENMRQLQKEALLRWRLFSLREWRPLLLYMLFTAMLGWWAYAVLPGWISQTIDSVSTAVREFARSPWDGQQLDATVSFGDQALLGALEEGFAEERKDQFRMDRWLRWLNDGIRPRNPRQQVLVVESPTFSQNFRSFDVSILAKRDAKIAEGVAFLVSNAGVAGTYRPVYRQLSMRFDQSGENSAEVKLASPNEGEHLLLILRAVSSNPDANAELPTSPDSFNIHLRIQ